MPRGVKRERNLAEEMEAVSAQIARHESALKELKAQLSALREQQEQTELKNLNKLLKESGMSVKEVAGILAKPKEEIA